MDGKSIQWVFERVFRKKPHSKQDKTAYSLNIFYADILINFGCILYISMRVYRNREMIIIWVNLITESGLLVAISFYYKCL